MEFKKSSVVGRSVLGTPGRHVVRKKSPHVKRLLTGRALGRARHPASLPVPPHVRRRGKSHPAQIARRVARAAAVKIIFPPPVPRRANPAQLLVEVGVCAQHVSPQRLAALFFAANHTLSRPPGALGARPNVAVHGVVRESREAVRARVVLVRHAPVPVQRRRRQERRGTRLDDHPTVNNRRDRLAARKGWRGPRRGRTRVRPRHTARERSVGPRGLCQLCGTTALSCDDVVLFFIQIIYFKDLIDGGKKWSSASRRSRKCRSASCGR